MNKAIALLHLAFASIALPFVLIFYYLEVAFTFDEYKGRPVFLLCFITLMYLGFLSIFVVSYLVIRKNKKSWLYLISYLAIVLGYVLQSEASSFYLYVRCNELRSDPQCQESLEGFSCSGLSPSRIISASISICAEPKKLASLYIKHFYKK